MTALLIIAASVIVAGLLFGFGAVYVVALAVDELNEAEAANLADGIPEERHHA